MTDRNTTEEKFDRLTADMRRDGLDPETVHAATERVWQRITGEVSGGKQPLATCEDYQALIPALVRGELSAARTLLVRDHTRECVPCRRVLMNERGGTQQQPATARGLGRRWRLPVPLRVAAAAVLALGTTVIGWQVGGNLIADRSLHAAVHEVDGALHLVSADGSRPLAVGDTLRSHQRVRTAKDSGAFVTLEDGSVIEMDQRSELELRASRRGTTIDLARGNIIVHAAEQHGGRLFVATDECQVAVKGTIFSVVHGLKGSRVSVIEGEVEVRQGTDASLLHPGDQVTTDQRLGHVSVEDEIAWSRNAEEHLALLAELRELQRELGKAVDVADARTSTRLLDLAPADTVIYAAIPNLTEGLVAAREVFEARLATSPALSAWWNEQVVASGVDREIDDVLDRLQPLGEAVGDEVVISVPAAAITGDAGPVVMAVLADPSGFETVLAEEVERLNQESPDDPALVIIDDPAAVTAAENSVYLWVVDDLFAASPDLEALNELGASLDGGQGSAFVGCQLHERLSEHYRDGVEWVFGLDLRAVIEHAAEEGDDQDMEMLQELGILDATTFIADRRMDGEVATTRAALDFDGPRRGMAAWLAEPAPMGSLDFVSADASMAAAVVAKDAAVIFDELITTMAAVDPSATAELEDFERQYGFDLRNDLAATLGGEAAFALDGPMLPTPSWKLIVEVYDPATLDFTIERAVEEINSALADDEIGGLSLETTSLGGRQYRTISHPESGTSFSYTVVDGFLVAAPQPALIDQAIRHRDAGTTLPNSGEFRDMLPANGWADCSALSYRNLGRLAEAIPSGAMASIPAEALAMLEEGAAPSLYCVYGEADRIVLSGTGGSLFAMAPLVGLPSLLDSADLFEEISTADETAVSS